MHISKQGPLKWKIGWSSNKLQFNERDFIGAAAIKFIERNKFEDAVMFFLQTVKASLHNHKVSGTHERRRK